MNIKIEIGNDRQLMAISFRFCSASIAIFLEAHSFSFQLHAYSIVNVDLLVTLLTTFYPIGLFCFVFRLVPPVLSLAQLVC